MGDIIENELKETLKPEISKFKRQWKKIPRVAKIAILITAFIFQPFVLKQLGLITFNVSLLNGFSTKYFIWQSGNNNLVAPVLSDSTKCIVRYCSDFEVDDWIGEKNFIVVQKNPLILKSPSSPQLPGATMYYGANVGNFIANIFLTPQASASPNLVLTYGHFYRCILGDADYSTLTCQINQDYPTVPENWAYFDQDGIIHGKNKRFQISPFKPNKELEIRFSQSEDEDNTKISIKINDQVPVEWILPKKYQRQTQTEKIGIGLITTTYKDVQAVFKHFELDPKL